MGRRWKLTAALELWSIQAEYYDGISIEVDYSTANKPDRWWAIPTEKKNEILKQVQLHNAHSLTVNYRWIYPSIDGYGSGYTPQSIEEWTSCYALDFKSETQTNVETGSVRRFRVRCSI